MRLGGASRPRWQRDAELGEPGAAGVAWFPVAGRRTAWVFFHGGAIFLARTVCTVWGTVADRRQRDPGDRRRLTLPNTHPGCVPRVSVS